MEQKKCVALLASTKDIASMNVYEKLTQQWQTTPITFEETPVFVKEFPNITAYLLLTQKQSVYCEHIDVAITNTLQTPITALIFLTKHASKSGKPSFSVHTQGNWDKNELGGNPQEIALCPVVLKHILFRELQKQNTLADFEVVNECTHHGPSIAIPSMFIEIGSTENEWDRQDAGQIMASVLTQGLTIYNGELDPVFATKPTIIGFGGTHTCSNFARLITEDKALLSHVCPNYAIDTLSVPLISQAIAKSTTTNTIIQPLLVIDWKSLTPTQRERLVAQMTQLNLPYMRLNELKTQLDSQNHGPI